MEEIVKQIASKMGVSEDVAAKVADSLHGDGHDIGSLLQGGDFMEKAKDLLGDRAHDIFSGIPGIGGLLGNLFGGGSNDTVEEELGSSDESVEEVASEEDSSEDDATEEEYVEEEATEEATEEESVDEETTEEESSEEESQ